MGDEQVRVTATVDVEHVRRQLLESIDAPGFGRIASNGVLAVDGLMQENAELRGRVRELENLPATRTCKCGGDDDVHSDTCPRSPTVVALGEAVEHLEALAAVVGRAGDGGDFSGVSALVAARGWLDSIDPEAPKV